MIALTHARFPLRKPLAAAAMLVAAGASFAQSSVTLFGIVDATVVVGRGSVASRTQLASSGYNASRLGFRGVEDLGGGLSASFWLEAGLNNDNGTGIATNTNNQASGVAPAAAVGQGLSFNRRSTVSLAGGWGELRLGRDYTPQFWNLVSFDPFGILGVGATQAITAIITGPTATNASNSIGYFLPGNLGGVYGQLQYYLGENASNAGATAHDGRGAGVRLGYASGPLNVAVALSRTDYAGADVRQDNVGLSWDFGVAKLLAQASHDGAGTLRAKGFLVGTVKPLGVGDLRLAYSGYRTSAPGEPTTRKLSLGYVHHLSKRTALYTTYARVRNSGGAAVALGGAITAANASSSGLNLGIRHSF